MRTLFQIVGFVLIVSNTFAQLTPHNRFKAGFSVKEIDTAGVKKISIGEVYLDKNQRNLFFYQEFPTVKETKLRDSVLTTYQADTVVGSLVLGRFFDISIYNLMISSYLSDFGLTKRGYKLENVKEEDSYIVSIYQPKDGTYFGKVELAKDKTGNLKAVIVYSSEGVLLSKTFLSEYETIKGLKIPEKIVQFAYLEDKVAKKITTLRDVKIDEQGNSSKYIN